MNNAKLDPFKSDEERFFWSMVPSLPQIMDELFGSRIVTFCYEPMSLQLGGGVIYTPDFLVYASFDLLHQGNLALFFEIKGSKDQKGYAQTRTKLTEAASIYPMFVFVEVLVNARQSRFESFEILTPAPFPYTFRL